MPQTKRDPRSYAVLREVLEKANAGRRTARQRRIAEAAALAEKIATDEARRQRKHDRDPRVKLYRRERVRHADRLSAPLEEAKAIWARFLADDDRRKRGGRPARQRLGERT